MPPSRQLPTVPIIHVPPTAAVKPIAETACKAVLHKHRYIPQVPPPSNIHKYQPKSAPAPDNELKTLRWSDDEKAAFRKGIILYGPGNWKVISNDCVRTRSADQVKSHAQKVKVHHREEWEELIQKHMNSQEGTEGTTLSENSGKASASKNEPKMMPKTRRCHFSTPGMIPTQTTPKAKSVTGDLGAGVIEAAKKEEEGFEVQGSNRAAAENLFLLASVAGKDVGTRQSPVKLPGGLSQTGGSNLDENLTKASIQQMKFTSNLQATPSPVEKSPNKVTQKSIPNKENPPQLSVDSKPPDDKHPSSSTSTSPKNMQIENETFHKGAWSIQEKRDLYKGILLHGNSRWLAISITCVITRSADQIKSHVQKFIKSHPTEWEELLNMSKHSSKAVKMKWLDSLEKFRGVQGLNVTKDVANSDAQKVEMVQDASCSEKKRKITDASEQAMLKNTVDSKEIYEAEKRRRINEVRLQLEQKENERKKAVAGETDKPFRDGSCGQNVAASASQAQAVLHRAAELNHVTEAQAHLKTQPLVSEASTQINQALQLNGSPPAFNISSILSDPNLSLLTLQGIIARLGPMELAVVLPPRDQEVLNLRQENASLKGMVKQLQLELIMERLKGKKSG